MAWDITGYGLEASRVVMHTHQDDFDKLAELRRCPPTRAELFSAIATVDPAYRDLPEQVVAFLLRKPESLARLLSAARSKRAELEPLSDSCDLDALEDNGKLIGALLCYDAYYGDAKQ